MQYCAHLRTNLLVYAFELNDDDYDDDDDAWRRFLATELRGINIATFPRDMAIVISSIEEIMEFGNF